MNIRQLMSLLKILQDVISALICWGIYSTIAPHSKNKMDWVKKNKKKKQYMARRLARENMFSLSLSSSSVLRGVNQLLFTVLNFSSSIELSCFW